MCLNPIQIKNPCKGHGKDNKYMSIHDCTSAYIYVPCGHCAECRSRKQNDIVTRLHFEEKSYYMFFVTLTYDNKHLPVMSIESDNGAVDFKYANFKHLQDMFKRFRQSDIFDGRNFRYIAVSELGKIHGRPHFHIIFLLAKKPTDTIYTGWNLEKHVSQAFYDGWSINVSKDKFHPKYESLFEYHERIRGGCFYSNFDCHLIEPNGENGTGDVAFYVTKYLMKDQKFAKSLYMKLKSLFPDTPDGHAAVRSYWRIIGPKMVKSLYFGLNPSQSPFGYLYDQEVLDELHDSFRRSVDYGEDVPKMFHKYTGKSVPIPRYYVKKFIPFECALYFSSKRIDPFTSAPIITDETQSDYSPRTLACRRSRAERVDRILNSKYGVPEDVFNAAYIEEELLNEAGL